MQTPSLKKIAWSWVALVLFVLVVIVPTVAWGLGGVYHKYDYFPVFHSSTTYAVDKLSSSSWNIVNTSTNTDYFVPNKTPREWMAFYNNHPNDISPDCVSGPCLCWNGACDFCGATDFTCDDGCMFNNVFYPTVKIGNQCWFAADLHSDTYPDGTTNIAKGPAAPGDPAGWRYSPYYYSCPPNSDNDGEDCSYGDKLYMWNTMMGGLNAPRNYVETGDGPQGICPANWQIPTFDYSSSHPYGTASSSFGLLYQTVNAVSGCAGHVGACLRGIGWESGFNAQLIGQRTNNGDYDDHDTNVYYWSASSYLSGKTNPSVLNLNTSTASGADFVEDADTDKYDAFSVRCVRPVSGTCPSGGCGGAADN